MGGELNAGWDERVKYHSREILLFIAAVVLALLMASALVVVARRLAGALQHPLEPTALVAAGILMASAAAAIRLVWFLPSSPAAVPWLGRSAMILTSLSVAVLAAGLCLPGASALGTSMLWILVGVEESWAWGWLFRRRRTRAPARPRRSVRLDGAHGPTTRAGANIHVALPSDLEEGTALSEDVIQQLTRSRAADGAEGLSGWLRMAFAAGQRTGSIHVAFCPPFAAAPEVEVEQVNGPEARIKTAQLLPYGVRLDLKLVAASESPTHVLLQFSAHSAQQRS